MNIHLFQALNLLKNTRYINKKTEHYERLLRLRRALKEPDAEKYPHLCDGRVTAVWYLSGLTFDDNNAPQLLVRASASKDAIDRVYFNAELHRFAHNDIAYDYDSDLMDEDALIGQQLVKEIKAGRVYTIYDRNREENK